MPEESTGSGATEVDIVPGFPEKIEGEILFLDADNISTDGIYPGKPSQTGNTLLALTNVTGKYTYQDDVTKDKMAQVCMENYDPAFSGIARAGGLSPSLFSSFLSIRKSLTHINRHLRLRLQLRLWLVPRASRHLHPR